MHINWQWIRQRPHVFAEQLARQHDVRLLHYRMFHRHHRAAEAAPPMPAQELQRVPDRLQRAPGAAGRTLRWVQREWIARQVARHAGAHRAELVWLTHPDFARAAQRLRDVAVVYDCMDDHAAFGASRNEAIVDAERALLARSDLVVFSSATLAARVCARAQVGRHVVVNNGVSSALAQRPAARLAAGGDGKQGPVMGYFGTVARWFDWPLVLRLLDALPGASLRLAGPAETAIPEHPRIRHVGVLPHAQLGAFVEGCDWLVMPFVVDPLIEAVDPVKLYEYVAFGRPALAPRYRETERFRPWVQLYGGFDEALAALAAGPVAPDRAQAQRFLRDNTWESRATTLSAELQRLSARSSGARG